MRRLEYQKGLWGRAKNKERDKKLIQITTNLKDIYRWLDWGHFKTNYNWYKILMSYGKIDRLVEDLSNVPIPKSAKEVIFKWLCDITEKIHYLSADVLLTINEDNVPIGSNNVPAGCRDGKWAISARAKQDCRNWKLTYKICHSGLNLEGIRYINEEKE